MSTSWTDRARLVALAGLLALSASPVDAVGTFAEAKALAAKEGKPLLVDFFTEW